MKIDNTRDRAPLYIIRNGGVRNADIYVTGSHLVYDDTIKNFIKVENYSGAEIAILEADWFSCLITSNHRIKIGQQLFWDWEDHFVKIEGLLYHPPTSYSL